MDCILSESCFYQSQLINKKRFCWQTICRVKTSVDIYETKILVTPDINYNEIRVNSFKFRSCDFFNAFFIDVFSSSRPGLSNLLHACIFLHSWTFWFAHLDFYTNKPGSDLNPHETPQILLIKCCPFKIFHQKFCTLSQKVGHPCSRL